MTTPPMPSAAGHRDKNLAVWTVIGCLRPWVSSDQAFADVKRLFVASKADAPDVLRDDVSVMMEPLRQRMGAKAHALLPVLAGAVDCLLLIACANVANLLLARWSARSRELAVRAALCAAWLPARRAAAIDPGVALRQP